MPTHIGHSAPASWLSSRPEQPPLTPVSSPSRTPHGVSDTHTPSSICAAPVQAAPARDGFMMKLASTEEEVFTRIGAMMPVVNEILSINDGYLRAKGIETA